MVVKKFGKRRIEAIRITPTVRADMTLWPRWMLHAWNQADKDKVRLIKNRLSQPNGRLRLIDGKRSRLIEMGDWLIFYRRRLMVLSHAYVTHLKNN